MDISVVVPLYNEEESLPELYRWIEKVMKANGFSFEVIFVNDGSTDNSWQVIEDLSKQSENVKGIKFRRNYGKSPALYCGFKEAQGDVVITMDADLQDSPDEIPGLYKMITEDGYDLVSGYKQKRYDPLSKTIPTKLFNATARKISGIHNLHDFNCGLKAYRRDVIKNIEVYGEMHRYIPYLAKNAGFDKIGEKVVHHQARKYGKSKFGLNRFFNGYLDLITLWFLSNFGKSPALYCGFKEAQGDVVITMDADLQDSPDEIPGLYKMITEDGYDLVSGYKQKRYDPLSKTIPTKLFNATARKISGIHNLHDFNCGLKAYRRDVIKNIEVYGEMHRYIPYLAKNAGFDKIGEKVVHHQARKYGKSKFGLNRFFNGYLDLITLWFLSNFGKKPMHVFGFMGTMMFIIGFISAFIIGADKLWCLSQGIPQRLVTDSPYFFIALTMMMIGTQLFLAGFIGDLVSRSSQNRNDYQIEKTLKCVKQ